MFVPAEVWFCCLTAAEVGAVASTSAAFVFSLEQPVPLDTFETLWGLSTLYNVAGIDTVLYLYGLEHTFIIIEDAPPIPAVGIVNLPLWLDIEGFILTGGGFCSDGCDTPTFTLP